MKGGNAPFDQQLLLLLGEITLCNGRINLYPTTQTRTNGGSLSLPTLLIVDDEPLMTEMLSAYLTRLGYHIETACNGQVALDLIRQKSNLIRIVITDMMMPVMNGVQLAFQLSLEAPDIPVLLATGRDAQETALNLPFNVVEVVQKPYQSKVLAESIKAQIGKSALEI